MRTLLMIIGFISGILALIMTILPFGSLAFLPIAVTVIMGILVMNLARKEKRGILASKILLGLAAVGLVLGVYQTAFNENVVHEDEETIKNEEESLEDAKKELEDIEIDE